MVEGEEGITDTAEGEQVSSQVPFRCQHLVSTYASPVSRGKVEQEMKYLAWQVKAAFLQRSPS